MMDATTYLGLIYRDGLAGKVDYKNSYLAFEKACNLGDDISCVMQADFLREEISHNNAELILNLYTKGCTANISHACFYEFQFYAFDYVSGIKNNEKNEDKAHLPLIKSCILGNKDGCEVLIEYKNNPLYPAEEYKEILQSFCNEENETACDYLKKLFN